LLILPGLIRVATIKEVADHAGVSVATVSRVVNKTGYVSLDLQERVQNAMRTLNYRPSALARSLRRQETQTIGILVPQLDQPFFSALVFAVEKTLFSSDYRALICSAEERRDKEDAYIEMLMRQRVDGVILVPTGQSTDNVRRLLDEGVPVVLVDRDIPNLAINRVLCNNYPGGASAIEHLLALGHRRIGMIGGPDYSEAIIDRMNGAREALLAAGVEVDPALCITGSMPQFEMGYTMGMQLLDRSDRPTAIFAFNDVIAIGVLHAAAELGLRLPDDLSVIGFDDIPAAAYSIPELTTVAQPIYAMGEQAANLLIRHIRDSDAPVESVKLETQLIIRKSTAPPNR
jgi:LacI family transcriptional regulator